MTNFNSTMPTQTSAFNGAVASLFSAALLVAVGVLTFTAFIAV